MPVPKPLHLVSACLLLALATGDAAAKKEPFDVNVVNDASSPVSVNVEPSPADEPILLRLSTAVNAPVVGPNILRIENVESVCVGAVPVCTAAGGPFVVPADKVLVIETVSVLAQINIGGGPTDMLLYLNIEVPGSPIFTFDLGRADFVRPGQLMWEQTYGVVLRAPAGSTVDADAGWLQSGATTAGAAVNISGRLVDAP